MIELGAYRFDIISDGLFEDDASTFVRPGSETGQASTVTWRRKARVKVGFNSLLVRGKGRTVVIDPGTGDKPRADKVRQYHLEWPRQFLGALERLGVAREAVDTVILTHLHWDHCGACTSLNAHRHLIPTFPRARYFVQKLELEAARLGDDGYQADDFEPLAAAGVLFVIEKDGEILPDFSVRWTGGHSRGHQIVFIECGEQRVVYPSDILPTAAQIPLNAALSYDLDTLELKTAKKRLLAEAEARRDVMVFVHAPRVRAGYLQRGVDGRLVIEPINESTRPV
jgi:glyoxylase-like metal-dependent hydrolase (beta-lactamase superfamily II)